LGEVAHAAHQQDARRGSSPRRHLPPYAESARCLMSSSKGKRASGTGRALMVGSAILFGGGGGLLLVLLYTGAHLQSIRRGAPDRARRAGRRVADRLPVRDPQGRLVRLAAAHHRGAAAAAYVLARRRHQRERPGNVPDHHRPGRRPGRGRSEPGPVQPEQQLAKVSDWLTKLLLGAGLVSLTQLGKPLSHLVDTVARGVDGVPLGAAPTSAARPARATGTGCVTIRSIGGLAPSRSLPRSSDPLMIKRAAWPTG